MMTMLLTKFWNFIFDSCTFLNETNIHGKVTGTHRELDSLRLQDTILSHDLSLDRAMYSDRLIFDLK